MKHLFILLFTACTLLTYAQVPEGYPANYAKAPRFKALIYYTQHAEEASFLIRWANTSLSEVDWKRLPLFSR